ncbi:MAG TPA: cofactor-independent phosphoglycerate mutase [Phycisphaerae bacterium]|nr:cofactor-independent phosphoglycerate mutase [Phycisphaerae bacterium]
MKTGTKYAIILPDGAADEPVAALGDRTPLEAAEIPHMHSIAETGRIGTVRTVPEGLTPGSDVATMSLFGYDPRKHYTGRAPIEAVARNLRLRPDDVVFRCNFVNVTGGEMTDFTAGHIRSAEAQAIIDELNAKFSTEDLRFHAGVSYRNLLVLRDPTTLEVACMPPHDIPGEAVSEYLPKGKAAERIRRIMEEAEPIVTRHDVNQVRKDLGELPATAIWLWGQGLVPIMRRFRQRFGVRGAAIAAVDLIRGLAKLLGWTLIDVPGATGYLDTDYAAKGRAAVAALDEYDLVAVHIEAPDEAGHMGDAAAKVTALEQIDQHIVEPILEKLRGFPDWRILIAPDHPTPVNKRTHTGDAPPFCMAGSDVERGPAPAERFCEHSARQSGLHIEEGHELMEYFLTR